jgi:hypothetical protein
MTATAAAHRPDPARTPWETAHDVYAPGRAYAYAPTREGGTQGA